MICLGYVEISSSETQKTITLPRPYINNEYTILLSQMTNTGRSVCAGASAKTTNTNFIIDTTSGTANVYLRWFAIGRWENG